MDNIKVKHDIKILLNGEEIIDLDLANILKEIETKGSLLKASQSLGIPYSRAWEKISKAEKALGAKLIETWKGGGSRGGTKLTDTATKLLEIIKQERGKLEKCIGPLYPRSPAPTTHPDLIIAYSHDHLIELLTEKLAGKQIHIEAICSGSSRALAMLSLDEADVACIHLYDPDTGTYNERYLQSYYIVNPVRIGGFKREIVFAYNPKYNYKNLDEIMEDLSRGKISLANRNPGSGTRMLLDSLLAKRGIAKSNIKGYSKNYLTHEEVAKAIAIQKAGAGLLTRYYAEIYKIPWIHVAWEKYECYTTEEKSGKTGVLEMKELLESYWFKSLVNSLPGYRVL